MQRLSNILAAGLVKISAHSSLEKYETQLNYLRGFGL